MSLRARTVSRGGVHRLPVSSSGAARKQMIEAAVSQAAEANGSPDAADGRHSCSRFPPRHEVPPEHHHPLVSVEARHIRYPLPETPGEHAIAGAYIQSRLRCGRHRIEKEWLVVDVVVPANVFREHGEMLPVGIRARPTRDVRPWWKPRRRRSSAA